MHYFLGLQVLQTKKEIFLSQSKYSCDILRHFHMEDFKPTPSPFQFGVKLSATCTSPKVDATFYRQLVGSLLYLTHCHPDLSFSIGRVARYMQTPHESHWKEEKKYFDIFEVQFSLGFITVQGGNLCWLVSLIPMIEILLQVMFSVWDPDLSLGLVRTTISFSFFSKSIISSRS